MGPACLTSEAGAQNGTSDLRETAAVLSKGLHRYDAFRKDAKGCRECGELWRATCRKWTRRLARILSHLKAHFEAEVDRKRSAA